MAPRQSDTEKAEMCTTLIRLYEVISNNSSPAIRFITSRTKTVDLLKTTSMNRRNDYSNKTLLKCTYTMLSGNICRSLQLLEKLHLISHPHHSLKQICLQVKEEQTQHTLLLYSLQTPSTGTYPEVFMQLLCAPLHLPISTQFPQDYHQKLPAMPGLHVYLSHGCSGMTSLWSPSAKDFYNKHDLFSIHLSFLIELITDVMQQ
ncbi:uncharacterized protein LOC121889199 isoform X2 [Thunnus maccoyii]|uniref:uncharacterized protein LOC121889199 isoform X2 n=1 Tax=Thunnus maccoyii TaxID=8240 RepID=UPI001C4CFEAF|nr:uncharacterized protein LOC121889199 isoform X2 [Thunnus maccoyii]